MAVTAATIKQRLKDTITAIATHTSTHHDQVPFSVSQGDEDPERGPMSSLTERRIEVRFGAGAEGDVHSSVEYAAAQEFLVIVMYPPEMDEDAQDDQIRGDVRDIKVAIDRGTNWGTDVTLQHVPRWNAPQKQRDPAGGLQGLLSVIVVQVTFLESNT